MDKNIRDTIFFLIAIAVSGDVVSVLKLTSIFLKANKDSIELTYKKDLTNDSKVELFEPYIYYFYNIVGILGTSLIPVYGGIYNVYEIYDTDEEYYKYFLELFNEYKKNANEYEDSIRKDYAHILKDIYEENKDNLPSEYKGNRIDSEEIRISKNELKKFLKRNNIIIKATTKNDEIEYEYKVKKLEKEK